MCVCVCRISNFDEDLRDGLAIFSAMSGYWPSCALKKPMLRTGGGLSPADCAENAEVIIRLLSVSTCFIQICHMHMLKGHWNR